MIRRSAPIGGGPSGSLRRSCPTVSRPDRGVQVPTKFAPLSVPPVSLEALLEIVDRMPVGDEQMSGFRFPAYPVFSLGG
jgi:hypothetical protein